MKIGFINMVNSSEYQNLLEERDSLIRTNERLHTNIQSLEESLKKSQQMVMEKHKVFCYLMDFYYTVHDSLEKVSPPVNEYDERRNESIL